MTRSKYSRVMPCITVELPPSACMMPPVVMPPTKPYGVATATSFAPERLAAIEGTHFSEAHELGSRVLRLLEGPGNPELRETGRIALRSLRAVRKGVASS